VALVGADARAVRAEGEALLVAGPHDLEQGVAVEALAVLCAGREEFLAIGPALVVEDDADFLRFVTQNETEEFADGFVVHGGR
jgi:hypothetical protein